MYWYWGILFNEGWSFIQRSPLNVVVASEILHGSRVGTVPCSSDIGCIQKVERGGGGVGVIHFDFGHLHNVGTNFLQNYGFRATNEKETSILFIKYKNFTTNGGGSPTTEPVAASKISCKECNGMC